MATRKEIDAAATVLSTARLEGCDHGGKVNFCSVDRCLCRNVAVAALEAAEGERCKFFESMFGKDRVVG